MELQNLKMSAKKNLLKIRMGKSLPSEEMGFSWDLKDTKEDSNMKCQNS